MNNPEAQCAAQLILAGGGHLLDPRRLFQHPFGLRYHLPANRGHHDFSLGPLENRNAEFLLEMLDGHTETRLAHEALLGRASEMAFPRHCH